MRLRAGTAIFGDASVAVASFVYGTTWKLCAEPLPGAWRFQPSKLSEDLAVQPWSLVSKSNDAISLFRNDGVGSFGAVVIVCGGVGPKRYNHAPRPYVATTNALGSPGVKRAV